MNYFKELQKFYRTSQEKLNRRKKENRKNHKLISIAMLLLWLLIFLRFQTFLSVSVGFLIAFVVIVATNTFID